MLEDLFGHVRVTNNRAELSLESIYEIKKTGNYVPVFMMDTKH